MTDQKTATASIFIFIFGFLSGVFVSSFFFIPPLVGVFTIFLGAVVLAAEKIHRREVGKEVFFLVLTLMAFGFGSLRYEIKNFHEPLTPASTGVVVSEPEQRENTTRFVMHADNGEKVLVNTDLYSPVRYGDKVEVSGRWQEPGIIDDGIRRPFDYGAYLSKDDIYHTLGFAEVEIVSHDHGHPIKHALFKLKHSLVGQMKEILPEPESSLLAGLVVAGKGAMPRDILEEFRRAGIIHIVVLSGYNVTIIAEFIRRAFESLFIFFASLSTRSRFFFRLSRLAGPRAAALAAIISIVLFVVMTGAEATVVRASIMVLAVIAARAFGRNYSAPRALLVAAFMMIIHNPKILVFDPSFQLSFLATCGLIWFVPLVERFLVKIKMPEGRGTRTVLATTVATQAAVLPFLVYMMGDVSLVSLPANILVLLVIPAAMFAGFVAVLVSFVSPLLALPISFPTHLILSWILGVSHVLGNLSFASVPVPRFPFSIVLLAYLGMILFVKKFKADRSS